MERNKKILGFGAAAVIALLAVTFFITGSLTSTTNAAEGGPEMRLTIPGGDCAGGECTVAQGASFTLVVEVVDFPEGGYVLAQTYIDMGTDLVYKPTAAAGDEFVWEDCLTSVALRENLNETGWLHGCLTGLLPPLPGSEYTGTLIELKVNCSEGESSTNVMLLASGTPPANTNGAVFSDPNGIQTTPKVSNLTINCGAGGNGDPTDTPEPTDTPGPTNTPGPVTDTPVPTNTQEPTSTPVPAEQCGDVNGDGNVTSVDAALILQVSAGLIPSVDRLENPDEADVNKDDNVDSRDALLVLQQTAGNLDCEDIARG